MVKYGESYIGSTSSLTASGKYTVTGATFDFHVGPRFRVEAKKNPVYVEVEAQLLSFIFPSIDAIKYREIKLVSADLLSIADLNTTPEVYVRGYSAMTSTTTFDQKECYEFIYNIRRMSTPYVEGRTYRYLLTDSFVYDSESECYSKPQTIYTFRAPYTGRSNMSVSNSVDFNIQRIRLGPSSLTSNYTMVAPPYNFTKASASFNSQASFSASGIFNPGDLAAMIANLGTLQSTIVGTVRAQANPTSSFSGVFAARARWQHVYTNWTSTFTSTARLNTIFRTPTNMSSQFTIPSLLRNRLRRTSVGATSTFTNTPTTLFSRIARPNATSLPSTFTTSEIFLDGEDAGIKFTVTTGGQTVDPGMTFSFPSGSSVRIYWGDGTNNVYNINSTTINHVYTNAGTYTIRVIPSGGAYVNTMYAQTTSTFRPIEFVGFNEGLTEVDLDSRGGLVPNNYFLKVPKKLPTTLQRIYIEYATDFNDPNVTYWNTSNLKVITFWKSYDFNQPIGSWNTGNLISLNSTFRECISFNQDISSWNTSSVTACFDTFRGATAFNQPLNTWNTSNVTNFQSMFSSATSFNQSLSSWNTAKATSMAFMFSGASAFNQPLTRSGNIWNTGLVNNMLNMFENATSFNQDLSGWCVSLIASEPSNFDTNTTSWVKTGRQPVWGTCP